jgi:nucleoside-diphosphate-sugar epimerase
MTARHEQGPVPTIAVAGATGDLGQRIVAALKVRGANVRALVRPDLTDDRRNRLEATGAVLVTVSPSDAEALAEACSGAACVVSALSGLRPVMIDRQSILLRAAIAAGVPRFIPSDFSEDFTRTPPGGNRNLDLRREFMARADQAPIRVTSILNGAFMDMLGVEMPIIHKRIHRVLYWRSADQPLDFTTKDDVAGYTAAAAMDEAAPRILRIAGDTVTVRQIAGILTELAGTSYKPLSAGGIRMLGAMISLTQIIAPQRNATFPPWQGMQYMRDMFSGAGKLHPIDNQRYTDIRWTSVSAHLKKLGRWRKATSSDQ